MIQLKALLDDLASEKLKEKCAGHICKICSILYTHTEDVSRIF